MKKRALVALVASVLSLGAANPDSFELLTEAESVAQWSGLVPVTEPVREGETAGHWHQSDRGTMVSCEAVPEDWSAYNALELSLYSDKDTPRDVMIVAISENDATEGGDYYSHMLHVDWSGWRDLILPLHRFAAARQPRGWDHISALRMHSRGWNIEPVPNTTLILDNVKLTFSETIARRADVGTPKRPTVTLQPFEGDLYFPPFDWDTILSEARASQRGRTILETVVRSGRRKADDPIATRKTRLQDIPENERDGRYRYAGDNAEVFALAMHDCRNAGMLNSKLVPAALAVRATGDADTLEWVVRQLREVATWSPLQRPGWTAYNPDRTLPPGGDGNWLATGYGMRGIVHTLLLLEDRLPDDLLAEIRALIQKEIDSIQEDWRVKRQWFVRGDVPSTNQWVLPNAAMIYGALYLGEEDNRDAYELGVTNLARTCLSQGEDGSWNEGLSYGLMSVEYLFWTAWAMSRNGDERLLNYGFAGNFPDWVVHMTMPGGYSVNAFDCGRYQIPTTPHNSFLLSILLTDSPTARWAVSSLFRDLPRSLLGLLYLTANDDSNVDAEAATPYAFFPHQQVLTWRSDWDQKSAMGLWVRGGSVRDAHCHRDNGHLSVYNGPEPILIEAGTPSYADPDLDTKYGRAAGHNILQIDEVLPRGRGCHTPITVKRMDNEGGEIAVDGTLAFNGVREWLRTIAWEKDGHVTIRDEIALSAPVTADREMLRFHTGSTAPVHIEGAESTWTARWGDVTMTFNADRAIRLVQSPWPDRSGLGNHACIMIQPAAETDALSLDTALAFTRKVSRTRNAPSYDAYRKNHAGLPPGTGVIALQAEDMAGDDTRFSISQDKVGAESCIYNWNDMGQELRATVDIAKSGLYRVLVKVCSGGDFGIPVRSVAWDSTVPFKEAGDLVFQPTGGWSGNTDDWQCLVLGQHRVTGGFHFALEKGSHTLTLTNEGGGGLNVDYIVVFPADSSAQNVLSDIEPGRRVIRPSH